VLRRFSAILALLAVIQVVGGHWIAMQSVAWIEMVIDYSNQSSIGVALQKTFDGQHPCDLCKAVSKGRSDEQKDAKVSLLVKYDGVLPERVADLILHTVVVDYRVIDQRCSTLRFPPPTPPPLAA
jgi:hypothetical protein